MIPFTLRLSKKQKEQLASLMNRAESTGDLAKVKQLLAILLFDMNNSVQEIKKVLHVSDQSIRQWIKTYLINGLRGLRSGKSPGRPPKLTKKQRKELYKYLKAIFVASKQDKQARQAWLESVWPEILSLGEKKKVFGLIDYFSGRFFSKGHEGKLNGDSYVKFLEEVLAKTRKPIILIQDGAPYHKSKRVTEFFQLNKKRLTIYRLPSYSPDFNPIEKLWKKIEEKGIHLKYFPTFDDLKNKVNQMLDIFEDAKKEVLTLFGFYDELNAN